ERREVLLSLADATFAAGDIEQVCRRYAQAAEAARCDADADRLARAALGFSQVRPYGVVDTEALGLVSSALERYAEEGPVRARLIGQLAVLEPDQQRREALIDEALAMADDDATLGWLYPAAIVVNWRTERAGQRVAAAAQAMHSAVCYADHGALV